MKQTFLLLLAAWVCGFLATGNGHAASVHDFTGQCQGCHLSDPQGNTLIFVGDLDPLCRECHPLPLANNHPSTVMPSSPLPAEFLWDTKGDLDVELSCVTCHAPHTDATDNPFLLRNAAQGSDFCRACHSEAVTTSGQHLAVTFLAHPRSAGTPLPTEGTSTLDPVSAECLICHDGTGGPHASFCLLLQKGQGCGGHIVSADYGSLANSNPALRPAAAVEETLALYAGEITCQTCHSIYSHEGKMLAISNHSSALCRICHVK